ncbi:MAG: TusE/DsrC/DsvC family sulfur relay protein [Pseudomonadaceae bacterium]|nr:TusE/DsrC/DsvC family sulfur relay protein [Pseudomonadaceae bacterium]
MKVALDDDGFLVNLSDWDLNVAAWLAENDGVKLLEAHIEVIKLLRTYYAKTQVSPAMRVFVKLVRTQLGAESGNSIYLMQLFGESPAKTAAKWAGLPRPTNCL